MEPDLKPIYLLSQSFATWAMPHEPMSNETYTITAIFWGVGGQLKEKKKKNFRKPLGICFHVSLPMTDFSMNSILLN